MTAGDPAADQDGGLPRPRGPGHWNLSLPADTGQGPAAGAADAAAAVTWWTGRLLGEPDRRSDLVHVRYAFDGSLAAAEPPGGWGPASCSRPPRTRTSVYAGLAGAAERACLPA